MTPKPTPAEEWQEEARRLLRPYAEELKFSQADWKALMARIEAIVEKAEQAAAEKGRLELNCKCDQPKPDGYRNVPPRGEGNYQRCLNCDRRIWK